MAPYSSAQSTTSHTTSNSSQSSLVRQQSYTHSFPSQTPSSAMSNEKGLSTNTAMLARQVLHPEQSHDCHDKTILFAGGLKWLLDSTAEVETARARTSRRAPLLTEDAVHTLGRKDLVEEVNDHKNPVDLVEDTRRIEDWVSHQTEGQNHPTH